MKCSNCGCNLIRLLYLTKVPESKTTTGLCHYCELESLRAQLAEAEDRNARLSQQIGDQVFQIHNAADQLNKAVEVIHDLQARLDTLREAAERVSGYFDHWDCEAITDLRTALAQAQQKSSPT